MQQTASLFCFHVLCFRQRPRWDSVCNKQPRCWRQDTFLTHFDLAIVTSAACREQHFDHLLLAAVCPLVTSRPLWDGTRTHSLFSFLLNHLPRNYGWQGTSIRLQAAVSAQRPLAHSAGPLTGPFASTRLSTGVCRNSTRLMKQLADMDAYNWSHCPSSVGPTLAKSIYW